MKVCPPWFDTLIEVASSILLVGMGIVSRMKHGIFLVAPALLLILCRTSYCYARARFLQSISELSRIQKNIIESWIAKDD